MEVKNVERRDCFFVDIDDREYIRFSEEAWYVRYGEAYEPIYYEHGLEKALNNYIDKHKI